MRSPVGVGRRGSGGLLFRGGTAVECELNIIRGLPEGTRREAGLIF